MNQTADACLYIRLRRRIRVPAREPVTLGRVAQMIVEPAYESTLRGLVLVQPKVKDGNRILIDMLSIVAAVKNVHPNLQIEHFGEPHTLVEIDSGTRKPNLLFLAAVWVLLFIGSGLTIMNFHADVSMLEVHQRVYELVTGKKTEHPLFLQIPYSLGIGIGMAVFFNHFFKKKFNEEPSPLEVEMFTYQENIDRYTIAEEYQSLNREKRESSP
ncbi:MULTISPECIES: stage V sporulation protein AA [Paenibacillus]|uniref:Stage V sporulation protein AA n=1 Tax=Paenibacillus chitinolyticus TaxID=79263 RepID=A0ABT4F9B0_9BACL|nr:stage V sporulation protein AA [Paenibacillus chitinolyticus]MCY9589428.1 stage V sporulation protein AA [Paenibacillus chitinolyticus]MCY9594501.1 stage V sporulation protein AA [Paenibacillus chitinolyticus]